MLNTHLFGYEDYKGTKCAVGEFKFKDMDIVTTFWIDAKTGTYLKIVNKGRDYNNQQYEYFEEYIATYGIVKVDDVKRPDLTGYTEITEK